MAAARRGASAAAASVMHTDSPSAALLKPQSARSAREAGEMSQREAAILGLLSRTWRGDN